MVGISLLAIFALLLWLGKPSTGLPPVLASPESGTIPADASVVSLGLVPERDLFAQRQAYRLLADYLQTHIPAPRNTSTLADPAPLRVELVTSSSYAGILQDFQRRDIDAAFLGSTVAVLAIDRYGAQVVLKSETAAGADTYGGVLFVLDNSPIRTLGDLKNKRVGGVATTSAGAVFPVWLFQRAGLSAEDSPHIIWTGTHDDVIDEVAAGNLDAGCVKDVRLAAWEKAHPDTHFRHLSTGGHFPENALVLRSDFNPQLRAALVGALLAMDKEPAATPVFAALGLRRFEPCAISEFHDVYDMITAIGPRWAETGIDGPPPRPLAARPAGGGH